MKVALARLVWRRARSCCEYCLMPQAYDDAPFEIDHIISRKHHGATVSRNLALSCLYCNSHKGSDIAGCDPLTDQVTMLFNPRTQRWDRHFRWQGPRIVGRSAAGRLTVALLHMNDPVRLELRAELIAEGIFF